MSDTLFRKRLLIFVILLAVIAAVIIVRYSILMLASPLSAGNPSVSLSERGQILDRNGHILAIQTSEYTVTAWGPSVKEPVQCAQKLADILGLDAAATQKKLTESKGWLILKNRVKEDLAAKLQALINSGGLEGIQLEETQSRDYPQGTAASNLLGFTGSDNLGMEGIEYSMNPYLGAVGAADRTGKSYGNQVVLTIDMLIQQAMEKIADASIEQNHPERFVLLALDAVSGEILAWVNRPNYDPNDYQKASPEDWRNLPVAYIYEPGSTFKIFSLSAIMQLGGIDDKTIFHTSGGYSNKLFKNSVTDLSDYHDIDIGGVIKYSSNVGAALASDTVTADDFDRALRAFGFGERSGIELSGEEAGLFKQLPDWDARTKPAIAFGQEIGVTAMQMVKAATVFGNEGVLIQPRVVKKILAADGTVIKEFGRETIREVLRPEVAHQMLKYMNEASGDDGTGRKARVEGIDLSVKTGTAQMIDPATRKYSEHDFVANAITLFPTQSPRIIIYVALVRPKGEIYGGRIAAPILHDAAEFIIPYLDIHREGDMVYVQDEALTIVQPVLPEMIDKVPDYRGLPLKSLLPLFRRSDIKLTVRGSGWVTGQSPAPGTPFTPGTALVLLLGKP